MVRYFRACTVSRWHLLWRSLVLPALPKGVRWRWLSYWARPGGHIPPYLRREARLHPALAEATEQFLAQFADIDLPKALHGWISAPAIVGASLAQRTLAAAFGVRQQSPLLGREVVELALGMAPPWMLANGGSKGFLREACRGRLPESLRRRRKNTAMAEALARRLMTSARARENLRDEAVRRRLSAWVGSHSTPYSRCARAYQSANVTRAFIRKIICEAVGTPTCFLTALKTLSTALPVRLVSLAYRRPPAMRRSKLRFSAKPELERHHGEKLRQMMGMAEAGTIDPAAPDVEIDQTEIGNQEDFA